MSPWPIPPTALTAGALSAGAGLFAVWWDRRHTPPPAALGSAELTQLSGLCLCGHYGSSQHSLVLADSPCLDCACPAFMKDGTSPRARYVDDGSVRQAFVSSVDRLWTTDPQGAE